MSENGLDVEKLKWLAIGSAVGAVMSMACAPAINHRDATARLCVCFGTAIMVAPLLTRMLMRWVSLPVDATAEVAILTAGGVSLASWWVIFALVKILQTRSDGIVEEGLAFLLPKRFEKSLRKPGEEKDEEK